MPMFQMLWVLSLVFVIALFLMCYFRERLYYSIINPLYIVVCAVFFFCWNSAAYERGWLQDGFMTLENISPYICTVILLTPFMSKLVKDFAYSAIAYLSFGMLLALYVSPMAEYFLNFVYRPTFIHISEAACHLLMALYGFYLFLSGKVTVSFKSYGKALLFTYASVGFGVFLNWCFHLGNFGMDMYGSYSIYFLDIFGSFEVTFVAYLLGILATITLGFLVGLFLNRISTSRKERNKKKLPKKLTYKQL